MTDNSNESIRRNTVTEKPKQEGKATNGTTVSELKAQFSSTVSANTTTKTISHKGTTTKKAQTSSKITNKKKKKKTKKFKRSPTLHRFFSYLEKNFSLLTLSLIVVLLLVAVFLTGIIIGVRVRHNIEEQIEEQKDLNYYIQENAAAYNIPYDVIYAVIETESSFRADSVSSTGARGLMQITKITLEELNNRLGTHYSMNDLFDPKINIRLGTFYLSILYKRFGDFETVYAAYNAGPTIVAEWLADQNFSNDGKTLIHDKIPYPETKRYVEKVIAFQENYLESHNS